MMSDDFHRIRAPSDESLFQLREVRRRQKDEQCFRKSFPDLLGTFDFYFEKYVMSLLHRLHYIINRCTVVVAYILCMFYKFVLLYKRFKFFSCFKKVINTIYFAF